MGSEQLNLPTPLLKCLNSERLKCTWKIIEDIEVHVGHVADQVLVAGVISALLEQGNNYRQAEQIYESLKAWVGDQCCLDPLGFEVEDVEENNDSRLEGYDSYGF